MSVGYKNTKAESKFAPAHVKKHVTGSYDGANANSKGVPGSKYPKVRSEIVDGENSDGTGNVRRVIPGKKTGHIKGVGMTRRTRARLLGGNPSPATPDNS